jgi:hypothetical protein
MKWITYGDHNSGLGLPAFAGSSYLWQDAVVESDSWNSRGRPPICEMSLAENVIGAMRGKAT